MASILAAFSDAASVVFLNIELEFEFEAASIREELEFLVTVLEIEDELSKIELEAADVAFDAAFDAAEPILYICNNCQQQT